MQSLATPGPGPAKNGHPKRLWPPRISSFDAVANKVHRRLRKKRNKRRLYVVVYPGGEAQRRNPSQRHSWGFMVGPKNEEDPAILPAGTLYHVKLDGHKDEWQYEEVDVDDVRIQPADVLARLLVAKVCDENRVSDILSGIPVPQDKPDWTTCSWMREATQALQRDCEALGEAMLD